METISIISIITIALFGSFGHCIGMCGGIVIAYSSTKIDSSSSNKFQNFSHLLYSLGRVTSYTLLGFIFGFVGGVVSFSNITSGILLLITGSLMVLIGFSLLGKIRFLSSLEHSCSKSKLYQNAFKQLLTSKSLLSFYYLGILNGLLPCGFVYSFAIMAASTGNAFWGAFVMFIFGLSTIPAMFLLGFFVSLFRGSNLRDIFIKISAILVILFGVYIAYKGYEYISDPTKTLLNCHI